MAITLLIVGLISLLTGLVLRITARRYRTELGRSIHWYDVRFWFTPWRATDVLTTQGIRLHVTSTALIVGGAALYLIVHQFIMP